MANRFATIDDYIASCPEEVKPIVEAVRRTIGEAVEGGTEEISYQIPVIKHDGRYVVYFATWKHHIGVYPVPSVDDALEHDLAPYRTAKATVRFPLAEPIPHDLIARLVTAVLAGRKAAS